MNEFYAFSDSSVQMSWDRVGCACAVYNMNEMIMSGMQRMNDYTSQIETLGICLATE